MWLCDSAIITATATATIMCTHSHIQIEWRQQAIMMMMMVVAVVALQLCSLSRLLSICINLFVLCSGSGACTHNVSLEGQPH